MSQSYNDCVFFYLIIIIIIIIIFPFISFTQRGTERKEG